MTRFVACIIVHSFNDVLDCDAGMTKHSELASEDLIIRLLVLRILLI